MNLKSIPTNNNGFNSHHPPQSQIESEKGRLAVEGTFMPPPLAGSVARSSILGADLPPPLSHGQEVQRQPPRLPGGRIQTDIVNVWTEKGL
jgi:hypothetical protein